MPHLMRVGLIGAGGIARFHAQALRKMPGVALTAVCDRDESRAVSLQQAFGVPHAFDSIAAMSRGVTLDAVHILLPPAAHAAVTVECLEKGWHVFIEKPLATTPEECRQVEKAALRAGRHVGVNHNLTFLPSFLRLVGDIRSRRLGRIESVHVHFSAPMPQLAAGQHGHWMFASAGNIVLELGPHPLSAIVRLMGPVRQAETVVSGRRVLKHGAPFFDGWHSVLTCDRGMAVCSLSVGGGFEDAWAYVLGQDGSAMVDLMRNTYTFSNKTRFLKPVEQCLDSLRRSRSYFVDGFRNIGNFAGGLLGLRNAADVFSASMRNSIAAFYEAVGRGAEPPAGIVEATAVIDACQTMIDAVHRGELHHAGR